MSKEKNLLRKSKEKEDAFAYKKRGKSDVVVREKKKGLWRGWSGRNRKEGVMNSIYEMLSAICLYQDSHLQKEEESGVLVAIIECSSPLS